MSNVHLSTATQINGHIRTHKPPLAICTNSSRAPASAAYRNFIFIFGRKKYHLYIFFLWIYYICAARWNTPNDISSAVTTSPKLRRHFITLQREIFVICCCTWLRVWVNGKRTGFRLCAMWWPEGKYCQMSDAVAARHIIAHRAPHAEAVTYGRHWSVQFLRWWKRLTANGAHSFIHSK